MVSCWKPVIEEDDARRLAERLGRVVDGKVEAVFYPVWLLAIEVRGRLPFLRGLRSMVQAIADGVSGKLQLAGLAVAECEVDADPDRIVETRLVIDDETRRELEEKLVPVVLARLRTPIITPCVRIVEAKHLYRKVFRMRVAGQGGEWVVYVDSATREHACLPAQAIREGGVNDDPSALGRVDVARDICAS